MTLTYALLCFLLPCLGSYLVSKFLFQYKEEPYELPQPKEYKDSFDPEDPSTWNYSYTRLMRLMGEDT